MDGFKRPTPRQSRPANTTGPVAPRPVASRPAAPLATPVEQPQAAPVERKVLQPIETVAPGLKVKKKRNVKKIVLFSALGVITLLVALLAAGFIWYQSQLSAVGSDKNELIQVTIASGTAPSTIGTLLEEKGVIRNKQAFSIYTRLTGTQNSLQAGKYRLSPGEATPEIVKHLTEGNVDTFSIRFLPGATLAENRDVLIKAGYTAEEVDTALAGSYTSPLFDTKPSGGDLEGYIYGETYNFSSNATVEDILNRTFAQFEKIVEENDLVAKFKAQGLTLNEGIILASIVQRESIGGDEADIAQVFLNRRAKGEPLGSDVTYQYAADKDGVTRDVNLESPYNTRIKVGLPPGPISAPGKAALLGVANPSGNDYLFFLSGDDDVTYFGKTLAEHEANIKAHCKVKCQII